MKNEREIQLKKIRISFSKVSPTSFSKSSLLLSVFLIFNYFKNFYLRVFGPTSTLGKINK